MKKIETFTELYLSTNIHVGLTAVFLTLINGIILHLSPSFIHLGFIFFITVLGYHAIRIFEGIEYPYLDIRKRLKETLNLDRLIIVLSITGSAYFIAKTDILHLLLILPALLLSIAYAVPLSFLNTRFKSLRYYTWIRLLNIGWVWTWVTLVFPYWESHKNAGFLPLFIINLLWIAAWVIPFDIMDMDSDSPTLKTLPGDKGSKRAKKISLMFLSIALLISSIFLHTGIREQLTLIFITLISAYFILLTGEHNTARYTALRIDAIPLFGWLFYEIISFFV